MNILNRERLSLLKKESEWLRKMKREKQQSVLLEISVWERPKLRKSCTRTDDEVSEKKHPLKDFW